MIGSRHPERGAAPVGAGIAAGAAGFTLIEMLVVIALLAMIYALVAPNLGGFVPEARLGSACKQLMARLDFARSQARIEAKCFVLRLDLEHHRYRIVRPPEERLRGDQTDRELAEEDLDEWHELEDEVVFAGAGNNRDGIARRQTYDIAFDQNGMTGDQIVVLKLQGEDGLTSTIQIQGITGRCVVVQDTNGREMRMPDVGEMAF